MSLFLVDNDAPGLELHKLEMLGRHCFRTYEILSNDVRVPAERLVGSENMGWECVRSGLQIERIASTAGYCGGAQAVIDLALAYAKDRKQFGQPIGVFQAIVHMLADMQTEVEAARMLMWRAAWMLASGRDALREIWMAKQFGAETYVKAANLGVQIPPPPGAVAPRSGTRARRKPADVARPGQRGSAHPWRALGPEISSSLPLAAESAAPRRSPRATRAYHINPAEESAYEDEKGRKWIEAISARSSGIAVRSRPASSTILS